jgi:tetratricopeptide (TPR) repeat protein
VWIDLNRSLRISATQGIIFFARKLDAFCVVTILKSGFPPSAGMTDSSEKSAGSPLRGDLQTPTGHQSSYIVLMKRLILLLISSFIIHNLNAQLTCASTIIKPSFSDSTKKILEQKLSEAKSNYDQDNTNADNIIWYGRRTAYLGNYQEAIDIFSEGIILHPKDARFYRHRGHRYLTIRCIDKAIEDFKTAAKLTKGKPDEVEPDGMPNAQNIPTSTLQTNIYYHLGLAYYLKGQFTEAESAYKQCIKLSQNPDMYVATANWYYITLRKLKKNREADKLLASISPEIKLIENKDYLTILLLYKQKTNADSLKQQIMSGANTLSNASAGFGLGNYFLLNGDTETAKQIFSQIISGNQWSSFGYIAAEAELKR